MNFSPHYFNLCSEQLEIKGTCLSRREKGAKIQVDASRVLKSFPVDRKPLQSICKDVPYIAFPYSNLSKCRKEQNLSVLCVCLRSWPTSRELMFRSTQSVCDDSYA